MASRSKLRFASTTVSGLLGGVVALVAVHAVLAVGGGCLPSALESSGTSLDGGASDAGKIPIATGLSSTSEQRTHLCATLIPKCPHLFGDPALSDVVVESCEDAYIKYDQSFVLAFDECSARAADCEGVTACSASVRGAIVPGYPNVPLVTDCLARHRSCESDRAYIEAHESRVVELERTEVLCREVPLLKESRKTTAEYCYREESCLKFRGCLWDDAFAQRDRAAYP